MKIAIVLLTTFWGARAIFDQTTSSYSSFSSSSSASSFSSSSSTKTKSASGVCLQQMLQFYGFEGFASPQSYQDLKDSLSTDYCPGISSSCCTRSDFASSASRWAAQAQNIELYLSTVFKVMQRVAGVQSSLVQLMAAVQAKGTPRCKRVDATYFVNPVSLDDLYFYLRNALEGFAFAQKGFYCTLCDSKQHAFLGVESGYGQRSAVVSAKFCTDLTAYFKEFLSYKVYFFDPLLINMNLALNCLDDSNNNYFKLEYDAFYQDIDGCLQGNGRCDSVCKEFRFGGSSKLFIGRLADYFDALAKAEKLVGRMGQQTSADTDSDVGSLAAVQQDFFASSTLTSKQAASLKEFNATNFKIIVSDDGINLFEVATNSNYNFAAQNAAGISSSSGSSSGSTMVASTDEDEEEIFAMKQKQMSDSGELPDSADVSSVTYDVDQLDKLEDAKLQQLAASTTGEEEDTANSSVGRNAFAALSLAFALLFLAAFE